MTPHETSAEPSASPRLLPLAPVELVSDEFRFLRGLIQGMRCGVLTIDAAARVRLVNEHARAILELVGPTPAGALIEEALPDQPLLTRVLRESLVMTNPPNRAELDLELGSSRRRIGFTMSQIRDPERTGPVRGVGMFFRDLTPIEQSEEQERLKDRLAALGEMAASMAHEIRNPLAAIGISCGLLKRRIAPGTKEHDLLDKIAAEVRRVDRTINSSLEFVRPVCPSLCQAELTPLLEEAVGLARERRPDPSITIRCELVPLPPFAMDRTLLLQVFVNLILNAVEAVEERGTVTVASEMVSTSGEGGSAPERFAVVRVADDGPGIPEGSLGRIFHPFFTTKKGGSGVGLSAAKKIVDGHRGLIDVDSAPSGGARFTVRLPMTPIINGGSIA